MSLGVCLAGGGVKGAAHIGALKALEEEKIKFDYISGTSSGSIVACLYACGYKPEEMYDIFKKYCKKIKYIDFRIILKIVFGVIFTGRLVVDGLNSGKVIEKLVTDICAKKGIQNINQIKMPLLIPSVDLNTGTVYCFTSKNIRKENRKEFSDDVKFINDAPIGKAVRASCSYPGVFCPCKYSGITLVDGGIRENVPWKETKVLGADKVLSIVFENKVNDKCCKNIIEIASRSIELIGRELSNYELDGVDCLIKIKSKPVSLLDTSKIDMLYELGYKQTKKLSKRTVPFDAFDNLQR